MNTYIQVFKTQIKNEIAYRFNAMMSAIGCIFRVVFSRIVWNALFMRSSVIGGLTLEQMIGYAAVSTALSQMELSTGVSGEIAARIRDGSFSKYMVVPVNVQGYFIAQSMGASAYYALVNTASALIAMLLLRIRLPVIDDPKIVLQAAIMIALGLLTMIQMNFFLGVLVLKFENINIFLMIKDHLAAFLTGALIPLSLLGTGTQSIMRIFPFYYVTYLPSMLLIGQCGAQATQGILVLGVWLTFLTMLNTVTYAHMRVRYDGVGI